ncbi:MAG TPA: ATP-binding protein [Catalimonadaceae bacterium]|jgi:serine/threonine-protein kinase RsbW|nr:ATP-binding protein [Catalimonadaceae bacterium]
MNPVTIEFPSILDNIKIVESFIDNSKEEYNISEDLYGNILVAITEAVNNAIQHGNQYDKEKIVRLTCASSPSEISFVIEDEGIGFDYHTLPDPTNSENILKPDGRGIFLMKHLCDVLKFENQGKKVEMVFYL